MNKMFFSKVLKNQPFTHKNHEIPTQKRPRCMKIGMQIEDSATQLHVKSHLIKLTETLSNKSINLILGNHRISFVILMDAHSVSLGQQNVNLEGCKVMYINLGKAEADLSWKKIQFMNCLSVTKDRKYRSEIFVTPFCHFFDF